MNILRTSLNLRFKSHTSLNEKEKNKNQVELLVSILQYSLVEEILAKAIRNVTFAAETAYVCQLYYVEEAL